MITHHRIKNVPGYVAWVNTNPDITGYASYHDAYIDQFEHESLENQTELTDYDLSN